MPRRPRPSSRTAPKLKGGDRYSIPAPRNERPAADEDKPQTYQDEDDEDDPGSTDQWDEPQTIEDEDDEDADAPRVVQWMDDEDDDLEEDIAGSDDENVPGPSKLRTLENDLSDLPLGALRKAQTMLHKAAVDSSGEEDNSENEEGESDGDGVPEESTTKGKEKAKPEWSTKPRTDIAKRSSKHAPMEVTSKRPVTRKRTVVEVKTQQPRDPRFLPLAGSFSEDKFRQAYSFITETHKNELATLRENLKRARKLLTNSPRDLREEREAEVMKLELALKRAESQVNKDSQDRIEQEALKKLRDEEKTKRKDGKKEWYMKQTSKREAITRARYEALASEGGKRAVKKAIEKKQKKIGQKEKRSRPYPKDGMFKRRAESHHGDEGRAKRRRVG